MDKREGKSSASESVLYRLWLKCKGVQNDKEDAVRKQIEKNEQEEVLICDQDGMRALWEAWTTRKKKKYEPLEFVASENEQSNSDKADIEAFQDELERHAAGVLFHEAEGIHEPAGARTYVKLSRDLMTAWVAVFAPRYGGDDVTRESVRNVLRYHSVFYGVDEQAVKNIVEKKQYFKIIPIAHGMPPKNGQDGELVGSELLKSDVQINQGSEGTMEYITFCMVKKGDVICRIVPPTEPQDGVNISGNRVKACSGQPVRLPKIQNSEMSEDRTALVSMIDGRLAVVNNKYVVDQVLAVNGDVDVTVGDLSYDGDILISGDVCDGFQVTATGDILIYGMVGNAKISAGKNVTIKKGVNGNKAGCITAEGSVSCKFIENCTVWAGGNIHAESIICSDVASDESIMVENGIGAIIGGSCTALKDVRALKIGTKSYRETFVANGCTSNILQKCMKLESELKGIGTQLENTNKDINYLERQELLTDERKTLLNKMRLDRMVLMMKQKRLANQYQSISEAVTSALNSTIRCGVIYPNTKIMIGEITMMINEMMKNCIFYVEDGELKIGNF